MLNLKPLSALAPAGRRARAPSPVRWAAQWRQRRAVQRMLAAARCSFVSVQQAWDRADLAALSAIATGPLLDDLREQLGARGPSPNRTEVLRLEARLLAMESLPQAQWVSVEFSGVIRESADARPMPFRELWMLLRPEPSAADVAPGGVAGSDGGARDGCWRVARVQALG